MLAEGCPTTTSIELRTDDKHRRWPIPQGATRLGHRTGRLTAGRELRWRRRDERVLGGSPTVLVVYLDTRTGEAVEVDRVIPRAA
jgi:hypothetical protein